MKWLPTFERLHKVCRGCDYPLEELPSDTCPECGREFDLQKPRTHAWDPKPPKRKTIAAIYFCPHLLLLVLKTWKFGSLHWVSVSDWMVETGPISMLRSQIMRPSVDSTRLASTWFVVQWIPLLIVVSWTHWRYVPISRHVLYSLVWFVFWYTFGRLQWFY